MILVCNNCSAVFLNGKDSKCPSCSAVYAFVAQNIDEAEKHHKGKHSVCEVCRRIHARVIAKEINAAMNKNDFVLARKIIRDNIKDALLAVEFVFFPFKHIAETILRQELGIEPKTDQNLE